MVWLWVLTALLLGLLVFVLFYALKYHNPYQLIFLFGPKGVGKSTYLAKLAQKYLKKGWSVFSTDPIHGVQHIDPSDIGVKDFPEKSLLLIDELGLLFSNRDFKQFPKHVRYFFKMQRHYKVRVVGCSQAWDIDKVIRLLTDKMFIMSKWLGVLTVLCEIKRKMKVVDAGENSESRIADSLYLTPFFMFPFGARKYCWIPRWSKYFDSFAVERHDMITGKYIDYSEQSLPRWLKKSLKKPVKRWFIGKLFSSRRKLDASAVDVAINEAIENDRDDVILPPDSF